MLVSVELLWVQSPNLWSGCEQTKGKECFLFCGGGRLRLAGAGRMSALEATPDRKSGIFKFLRFEERFRKASFSSRISVDDTPNWRNKAGCVVKFLRRSVNADLRQSLIGTCHFKWLETPKLRYGSSSLSKNDLSRNYLSICVQYQWNSLYFAGVVSKFDVYFRDIFGILGKKTGGGGSNWIVPSIWQSFIQKGKMACITPAWSSC